MNSASGAGTQSPPAFSVIIPAHDAAATLAETLQSIFLQSIDNSLYEVIVVDDCSGDRTLETAAAFAEKAGNIRVLRNNRNIGPGASRNRGIVEARGRYVCFVDADDILQSYALELMLQKIRSHNPQVVYANIDRISPHGDILRPIKRHEKNHFVERTIRGDHTFCPVSAAYCREFLLGNRILFPEGVFYEDMAFTVACTLFAENILTVNAVLYHWIEQQGSTTSTMKAERVADAVGALEQVHELLQRTGYDQKYLGHWKKLAANFLALTHRRIKAHAENPADLLQFLRRSVAKSRVFAEAGIRKELLRDLPHGKKELPRPPDPAWPALIEAAAGAVVMIAETDYHLRNYVAISRELAKLGVKTMICDLSVSSCFQFPRSVSLQELERYADTPVFRFDGKKRRPLFPNARAYVFSIDWGQFHPLLVAVKRYNIPAIAFYEGISDDYLMHPGNPQKLLPYRKVPYLLVPGEYYKSIYTKQQLHVTGLPAIHELLREPVNFPQREVAAININFSYKVLENCRELFLSTAVSACEENGLACVFSQHPADTADLGPHKASTDSIYDCLRQCSLLISRFSTCVLEALALGKPVIYHNPHREQFPKFSDPMGAYRISRTQEELSQAIRETREEIRAGVDFRKKAAPFLQHHVNAFSDTPAAVLAARALRDIVKSDDARFRSRILYHAGCRAMPLAPPKKEKKPNFTQLLHALIQCGKANLAAAWRDPRLVAVTLSKMLAKK